MSSKTIELLSDPSFANGFLLQGVDASGDNRGIKRVYKRDGKEPTWRLAQWWTPFDLASSDMMSCPDGYEISNKSRTVFAKPGQKMLELDLDSNSEYEARFPLGVRQNVSEGWAHSLIEQDFAEPVLVQNLKSLFASLSFSITALKAFHLKEYNPNLHAAQFLWYITIKERTSGKDNGLGGNYIWFGIPLFDNRTPFEAASSFYDIGNSGSTKKLIYSIDSRLYLPESLEIGKEYSFSFDVLPLMKKAIIEADEKGIFAPNAELLVNYMNFGWELPGNFAVKSYIKGISIKGETL